MNNILKLNFLLVLFSVQLYSQNIDEIKINKTIEKNTRNCMDGLFIFMIDFSL